MNMDQGNSKTSEPNVAPYGVFPCLGEGVIAETRNGHQCCVDICKIVWMWIVYWHIMALQKKSVKSKQKGKISYVVH